MADDNTNQELPEGTVQEGGNAETVTVSTEPQEQELLAGKFKTPEDLVKAYTELEKKLGAPKEEAQADPEEAEAETKEEGTEETPEEKPEEKAEGDLSERYGSTVADALTKAEIDVDAAAKHFEEHGSLSDEDVAAFEKAGFPRAMVDAYLQGVTASKQQVTEIGEAQIADIKAVAGGDEGFAELQQHIASQYTAAELEAYNEAIGSGDVGKAKAAVQQAVAHYQQEVGTEGKLLGGKTPNSQVGYASEAEYLEAMANPEYKRSQAYRDRVQAKLAQSPHIFATR